MTESEETRQLSDGDWLALDELYEKYHQRVYSLCLRMTHNVSESEDLTQDVFIQLFRKVGSFRGESAFTTWLHRLTVNQVLMHFRKPRHRLELTTEDGELPAEHAASNQNRRLRVLDRILLSEVIAKLPEGYRQAIVLHYIEGLGHKEIAARRGRSVGTSKSQLHKGRALLRELIGGGHRQVNRQFV